MRCNGFSDIAQSQGYFYLRDTNFLFALRSPMTARMKGLFSQGLYKITLRFFEKKSNSSWF